jgi:uncharacterized protein YggT (Ycf19 family)
MMDNEIVQQLVYFLLNFGIILSTLLFYSIFAWVIASWLIMFGIITPMNRGFSFLTQLVMPILKPFRWAKIGMIDLSPICAILVLDIAMRSMGNLLTQFI